MRIATDPLVSQVRDAGGQLIITDSSRRPVPDWAGEEWVRWLSLPGSTPYQLRQAGYAAAEAPVIAVTEDHCAADPYWVRGVIDEHERNPDAAAIFGMVDNGSRTRLIDWALYAAGYLASAPPHPSPHANPSHANLSFKADVIHSVAASGDQVLEFRYIDALRRRGFNVLASDQLLVTHLQSTGLMTTSALFFHNGRYIASVRRGRMTAKDWVRTLAPGLMALYRTLRTLNLARTRPKLRAVIFRSTPLIALLHALHAGGESVGYVAGPGDSAKYLH